MSRISNIESSLRSLNGVYKGSLFHACRALKLDPDNILYKEWILFFYEIPDHLVSPEETEKISKKILEEKPTSRCRSKNFRIMHGQKQFRSINF